MENISGQIQLGDPLRNRLKKLVAMTPWLQVAGPFGKSVKTVSPRAKFLNSLAIWAMEKKNSYFPLNSDPGWLKRILVFHPPGYPKTTRDLFHCSQIFRNTPPSKQSPNLGGNVSDIILEFINHLGWFKWNFIKLPLKMFAAPKATSHCALKVSSSRVKSIMANSRPGNTPCFLLMFCQFHLNWFAAASETSTSIDIYYFTFLCLSIPIFYIYVYICIYIWLPIS